MCIGLVLGFFMCDADKVIREDGTKVILMKNPSWKTELIGLWETLFQDPWIILLFPMFFVSNIFYTYQNNGLNGTFFNIRTRSLNGLLYWLAQIVGALCVGYGLDFAGARRSVRAKASWCVLTALTMGIWGGGYAWQRQQVSREIASDPKWQEENLIDWTDGNKLFLGPMFLYFFYGFFDAVWQTTIYWYMGSLSNNGRKAANMAGFYKGVSFLSLLFLRLIQTMMALSRLTLCAAPECRSLHLVGSGCRSHVLRHHVYDYLVSAGREPPDWGPRRLPAHHGHGLDGG